MCDQCVTAYNADTEEQKERFAAHAVRMAFDLLCAELGPNPTDGGQVNVIAAARALERFALKNIKPGMEPIIEDLAQRAEKHLAAIHAEGVARHAAGLPSSKPAFIESSSVPVDQLPPGVRADLDRLHDAITKAGFTVESGPSPAAPPAPPKKPLLN